MTRQLADGPWDSTLSTGEFAAVAGVGFEPVGQVLGTAVFNLGNTGAWACPGAWTTAGGPSSPWDPSLAPLAKAVHAARRLAVARAVAECRTLHGDGIVGVRLTADPFPAGGTEFTAIGTAVRAVQSRIRPRQPFASHLGGQDFARLLHAGWVPTGLAFGVSLAIRHDDWRASGLTGRRRFAGNQEVDGHTRLLGHVRREARARLALDARRHGGGDGVVGDGVVGDDICLDVRETECPGSGSARDLIAEAVFVGTSIARFGRSGRPATTGPLTIMRLEREH
ncbi:heavy metal-binding domain-containing protein [Streptomyces sp. NPDC047976]|uniref:heavy metal-binding domain-containing protein n=1 Tax=Streptomyces sp. NPDC047976 TaxID=3155746 RepID=UPI00341F180B